MNNSMNITNNNLGGGNNPQPNNGPGQMTGSPHQGGGSNNPNPNNNNNPIGAGGMSEEQMRNAAGMGMGMAPGGTGMGMNMNMGGHGMGGHGMVGHGMGGHGMGGMGMGMMGNPYAMQGQGDMGSGGMDGFLGQGGGFVPDLDMMALLRAKQKLNMMNRGPNGVQDKYFGFQDQFKGQGMPGMGRPEDFQVSSAMIDKLKRSSDENDDHEDEHKGKKRKKAKKPNDMPRRALSAYNIFFSEQREIILKEINAKEKAKKMKEEGKTDEEIAAEQKKDAEEDEAEKKKEEEAEKEKEKDGVPDVMNRTFFPTRAKRAHRKVHGKIGLVSLAREVSARWKALSPEKRKHYQDLAEKDRERHKKVMADYQERKAAENMISMGSPTHESQDAPAAPPAQNLDRSNNDQDVRDSMAQQYQQRILAEMMAARQQQAGQQMMGMGMMGPGMMGMGGMSGMNGMGGMNGMAMGGMGGMMGNGQGGDPNLLGINMNNPSQAQMWRQMGMGPL